jgi:ferric-dicitrate binding protein FerR (iron transport regulator)
MQRALELIQKHLDEIATPAERAELGRLLAQDPAVAAAFAQATRVDAFLSQRFGEEGALADIRPLIATGEKSSRRAVRRPWRWLAAAIVLFAVGVGLYFQFGRNSPSPQPVPAPMFQVVSGEVRIGGNPAARIPEGATVAVAGNQPATIVMPDGSRTELAPASIAVFQGSKNDLRQMVELIRGTGKFLVAKGNGQFRVETAAGTVTVLGTEFTARLQGREKPRFPPATILNVDVTEGSVQVDSAGKAVTLTKGERREFVAEKKADLVGRIEAVREEGKIIEVVGERTPRVTLRVTPQTGKERIGGPRLMPGQRVSIWLDPEAKDTALYIEGIPGPK